MKGDMSSGGVIKVTSPDELDEALTELAAVLGPAGMTVHAAKDSVAIAASAGTEDEEQERTCNDLPSVWLQRDEKRRKGRDTEQAHKAYDGGDSVIHRCPRVDHQKDESPKRSYPVTKTGRAHRGDGMACRPCRC
jgi:hypothetical protein